MLKAGILGTLLFALIPAVLLTLSGLEGLQSPASRSGSSAAMIDEGGLSFGERRQGPPDAGLLASHFDSLDYTLQRVRAGETVVPRVFLEHLPPDLAAVPDVEARKALFIRGLLPVILMENERLADTQRELVRLRERQQAGAGLPPEQQEWLLGQFKRYRVETGDWQALLQRAGRIPVSLALAQAALESAWGTSRFAREGRALFGQWTWSPEVAGIVPRRRPEGERYRVRAFPSLQASVRSYMHTLNTHRAYRDFRRRRAELRARGEWPNGLLVSDGLVNYSTKRHHYTRRLRVLIRGNGLAALDHAELAPRSRTAEGEQPGRKSWVALLTGQDSGR